MGVPEVNCVTHLPPSSRLTRRFDVCGSGSPQKLDAMQRGMRCFESRTYFREWLREVLEHPKFAASP